MEWNKSQYQIAGKRHHQPPEPIKQETNLALRYRGSSGSHGYDQRMAMPSLSNLHQDPSSSMSFLTSASMGMDQQQPQTNVMGSLDMQHFDENATVDLQQLFSSNGNSSVLQQQQQPMQSHYHLPSSLAELYPSHSHQQHQHQHQQVEDKPEPQYPHQQLFQSLQPAAPGPSMNECYFGESFPAFHSEANYGFSQHLQQQQQLQHQGQSAILDDRGELADINDASSLEIQEVSNLLSHTSSMVTPPFSAMNSARVSMVSPLHAGPSSSRSMMMMREDEQDTETQSAVNMAMGLGVMAGVGHVCTTPKFSADRRKLCVVEDCKSQARAFNRCKRHGGSKRCSQPGCTKSVQSRGLCIRHGGGSRCQETGCTRAAQSHGHCKMHGGGRPCIVAGCDKKAHLKRLCRKHGGGAKCNVPDCDKWAQRQGMCMTHAKHVSGSDVSRSSKRATAAFSASSSMQL